jgi:hypothetical protein
MVAGPIDYYFIADRVTAHIGRYFTGTIYLYLVLMKAMSRVKALETILVLALALGIIYWVTQKPYWLMIAMALAFIGLAIPWLAEKIHLAWMKLAQAMGFVMNRVILTLVYVIFLVPLSLLYKLFRSKKNRIQPGNTSYFKVRNYTYTKESLENPW